jgi:hypothetical protein
MKFCGECGTLLKNLCPQCESENPHSAFHNPQLEAGECFLKAIEIVQRQQQAMQQGWRNAQHVPCSMQYTTRCLGFTTTSLAELEEPGR